MAQLTRLRSLRQTTHQPHSQGTIQIKAEVPAIDYDWVKKSIKDFLEKQKLLNSHENIYLCFTEQPVEKNIIRCDINAERDNKTLIVTGQGIDEYQALEDGLQNLELELLLESTIQKSKPNFFFSNYLNQFKRGNQHV